MMIICFLSSLYHRVTFRWRSKKYRWGSYPALQAYLDWEIRSVMDKYEDETAGRHAPLCFATATRRISRTLGGHYRLAGDDDHHPIPNVVIEKGQTVRLCLGSRMGDVGITPTLEPSGAGCEYVQRVSEACRALHYFRNEA